MRFDHRRHSGLINVAGGSYRAGVILLDEASNLSLAFLANSPMDPEAMIDRFITAASNRRTGAPVPAPKNGMDRLRNQWNCALKDSDHVIKLRISNQYDVRGYNVLEFGGFGSEELWKTTAQSTFPEADIDQASGTYVWFRAGESARFPVSRGTWQMTRTGASTATLRRTDVGGWSGTYTCTVPL